MNIPLRGSSLVGIVEVIYISKCCYWRVISILYHQPASLPLLKAHTLPLPVLGECLNTLPLLGQNDAKPVAKEMTQSSISNQSGVAQIGNSRNAFIAWTACVAVAYGK